MKHHAQCHRRAILYYLQGSRSSPSLLFLSTTGEPCCWSHKSFCLYKVCSPQLTLKSFTGAYSTSETPWTSRDQLPKSAQRQDHTHLDHFWKRFILPVYSLQPPCSNTSSLLFIIFFPSPPQTFYFFFRLGCVFNALHNWQQKKSWGVFCFRQPLPSWMKTPFPESSHSAPSLQMYLRCFSQPCEEPSYQAALYKWVPRCMINMSGNYYYPHKYLCPTRTESWQCKEIYLTGMLQRFLMFQYYNIVKVYIITKIQLVTCSFPYHSCHWRTSPAERRVSKHVCSHCSGAVLCQRLGVERTVYMFSCKLLQTFKEAAVSRNEGQVILIMKAGEFPRSLVCQQRIQSQDR